jgi:hypothetical protein
VIQLIGVTEGAAGSLGGKEDPICPPLLHVFAYLLIKIIQKSMSVAPGRIQSIFDLQVLLESIIILKRPQTELLSTAAIERRRRRSLLKSQCKQTKYPATHTSWLRCLVQPWAQHFLVLHWLSQYS